MAQGNSRVSGKIPPQNVPERSTRCWSVWKRGRIKTTYEKLHLGNLFVNVLHKLNNKVYKLVLQHLLGVEVCY